MNLKNNKYISLGLIAFLTFVACTLFKQFIDSFPIRNILSMIISILTPFIIGFVIAYLLNPVMMFFEKKIFLKVLAKWNYKKKKSIIRGISLMLTFIIAAIAVVAIFYSLFPSIIESTIGIVRNLPEYVRELYNMLLNLFNDNQDLSNLLQEQYSDIWSYVQQFSNMVLPSLSSMLDTITSSVFGFVGAVVNFITGVAISIYVLFAKEKFVSQSKKVILALMPKKASESIISSVKETHEVFGKFFSGKIVDSVIIGIITWIGMLFIFPQYALLVGVTTGIFNMIPFFGPIIGAVPCALLILVESPSKCLIFIIFIIGVQQFDGNILGPKILGESTGLSAFWVMFAILAFSALFGFIGMFIGVPIFAVIYTWINRYINNRLSKKGLSTMTDDYYHTKVSGAEPENKE